MIPDDGYIRESLGTLLHGQTRLESDVAEIKENQAGGATYAHETRRRVDRNTTFARAIAWTGGAVIALVAVVTGYGRL